MPYGYLTFYKKLCHVKYTISEVATRKRSIPIVQIHFLVGQASCLSKLKGGQDANPTRNYFCKNGMHPP